MKTCTKCKETFPLDQYCRDAQKRDGLSSHCRLCRNAKARAYSSTPQRKAYVASWLAANHHRQKGYYTRYRQRYPERVKESRARGRERFRVYIAAYRRRNRERYLTYCREYERMKRAKVRSGLVIPFTQPQLVARMSMYPGCWICRGPFEQVDHVKPLAKGGAHILANLRPCCTSCNNRKRARWPFKPADIGGAKVLAASKGVLPSESWL